MMYTAPCTDDAPPRKSIMVYGGSITMSTVSGLIPGSTYYVMIVAVNGRGQSYVIIVTYMTEQAGNYHMRQRCIYACNMFTCACNVHVNFQIQLPRPAYLAIVCRVCCVCVCVCVHVCVCACVCV